MPITDVLKNRDMTAVPVKVSNKASEAVNVRLARGSAPIVISSKGLLPKFHSTLAQTQKTYLKEQLKQNQGFLRGVKALIVASAVAGIAYGGYKLYSRAQSKIVQKTKESMKDFFDLRKKPIIKVFAKAVDFMKEKFESLIEAVKSDFREILGPQLAAVWDSAKSVFGWVKKTIGWWVKYALIKFGARFLLVKAGVSEKTAKLVTSPLRMILSGKFWKFLFKPLFRAVWSLAKGTFHAISNLKIFSSWVGSKLTKNFTSFSNVFKGGIISKYASKVKDGMAKLAEVFSKGNTSLKDKIFGFLGSLKRFFIFKWNSIKEEEKLIKTEKRLRKAAVKEAKESTAKKLRNEETKKKIKSRIRAFVGNTSGTFGAQPGAAAADDGGLGFTDVLTLVGSYFGIDALRKGGGKVLGSIGKLGKLALTTRGGAAGLSGALTALQGGSAGEAIGAVGGSLTGQAAGAAIGGTLGIVGGPAGVAAGIFAGEMIGGFIGGWIGKNVGGMIEKDIKAGDSPSAGSAENAMYEAMVKANMVQTQDMAKLDTKRTEKYFGSGSWLGSLWDDISTWIHDLWNWLVNGVKNAVNALNTPGVNPFNYNTEMAKSLKTGTGSSIPEQHAALQFLMSQGATKEQAAGIVGNLMQESKLNPYAVNEKGTHKGIAQWDVKERYPAGVAWAEAQGKNFNDRQTQLEYLVYEAKKRGDWGKMMQTGSVESATKVWDATFERSGGANMGERLKYAKNAYDIFGALGGNVQPIAQSVLQTFQNCGDAVTKELNSAMISKGVPENKLLPWNNAGVGIPDKIMQSFGAGAQVPLTLEALKAAGPGTAIAFRRSPGDKGFEYGDTHAERTEINPFTNELAVKSYSAGKGFMWKSLTQKYIDDLPKNSTTKAANPFIVPGAGAVSVPGTSPLMNLPGTSPASAQIQNLETQKGVNAAQIEADKISVANKTAAGVEKMPGAIDKASTTQTNTIINQVSSGGQSSAQVIDPFAGSDLFVDFLGMHVSIFNP